MPSPSDLKREQLKRDEKEIGKNIPDEMIGFDTEDVGPVTREKKGRTD